MENRLPISDEIKLRKKHNIFAFKPLINFFKMRPTQCHRMYKAGPRIDYESHPDIPGNCRHFICEKTKTKKCAMCENPMYFNSPYPYYFFPILEANGKISILGLSELRFKILKTSLRHDLNLDRIMQIDYSCCIEMIHYPNQLIFRSIQNKIFLDLEKDNDDLEKAKSFKVKEWLKINSAKIKLLFAQLGCR
jgi:hypothetical protein